MQIDVIADATCPWCYVGHRYLEEALRLRPELNPEIRLKPFFLDLSIPREGIERKCYFEERFGSEADASIAARGVIELGAQVGIAFAFDKIARVPNTLNAHRLLRWAAQERKAWETLGLLFQAYFEHGADISDHAVLTRLARQAGLDATAIERRLNSEEDIAAILVEDAQSRDLGINGVPCLLIDSKYALMGAQDPETLVAIFDRIEAHRP